MKLTVAVGTLLTSAASVAGWGALVHESIGFIAQEFLAPNALNFVQTNLATDFGGSLGPAAPWADTVRSTKAFAFTAPFHFVDAQDSPLTGSCSVVETRDCATDKCILTAIANYTQRLMDTTLSISERTIALKFLDHFFGDIGQPLHVEAIQRGGNQIPATCNGASTNLHAAWDTGMPTQHIKQNHGGTAQQYAADLVNEIKTGQFASIKESWLNCSSVTEVLPTGLDLLRKKKKTSSASKPAPTSKSGSGSSSGTVTPLACPLVWAQESNAFDCSDVFTFTSGQDLCSTSYFTNAVPIIDEQAAKQGFRLAAWLNVIFDGATNL